jgi:D-alanyl-D-alanine endopeptidase (penicillin-binding protein 7)
VRRLVVVLVALAVIALAPEAVLAQASKSRVTSASNAKATAARTSAGKATKTTVTRSRAPVAAPVRPSEGQMAGLHRTDDPLDLKSSVALVVNQDTNEVLFQKNPHAVLPIASITKLMTALITVVAGLALDETLEVERSDRTIDRMRSWLNPGVRLTRGQALHLALMSSENHAAHLLGRTYPGGIEAAVQAMNAKAQLLGMHDTNFADPTGLSAENRSSPRDLVKLVNAAYQYPVLREYSTSSELELPIGKRVVRYGSTNGLTSNPEWEIGLQKTGYISAAGRCLVMQAVIEGQRVVMVLLDSVGKYSRIGDAQRIRQWLEANKPASDGSSGLTSADQPRGRTGADAAVVSAPAV